MTRLRQILYVLGGAAVLLLLLTACHHLAIAHAHAAADPVAAAETTVDTGWSLVVERGWVGVVMLAYAGLAVFLRRNEKEGWIKRGRALAVLTGFGAIAGAVLNWQFNAGDPGAVVTAIIGAIGLVISPYVVASQPTVAPPTNSSGPTSLVAFVAVAALLAVSCGARQRAGNAFEAGARCEAPNVTSAVSQLMPMAIEAIGGAISGDGLHIDRAKLRALATPFKDDAYQCAFDAAIAFVATPQPRQPGAAMAAGLEVDGAALRATWTEIRGDLGWPN